MRFNKFIRGSYPLLLMTMTTINHMAANNMKEYEIHKFKRKQICIYLYLII